MSSAWCAVYKEVVPLWEFGVSSYLGELVRITAIPGSETAGENLHPGPGKSGVDKQSVQCLTTPVRI